MAETDGIAKGAVVRERKNAARCGTKSGYGAHRRRREPPCVPCKQARAAYDKARQANPDAAWKVRLNSRAQAQALQALRLRHKDEYAALYKRAKQDLLVELAEAELAEAELAAGGAS